MNIIITQTKYEVNRKLASSLKKMGHQVICVADICCLTDGEKGKYNRFFDDLRNRIDIFINGIIDEDESFLIEQNYKDYCLNKLQPFLDQLFSFNQTVSANMMRGKNTNILFLLKYDVLRYHGVVSSPIYNNLVLSLVKSLSKELSSFSISVNALTLGAGFYFKQLQKENMKIFNLKPSLRKIEEVAEVVELMGIYNGKSILSGQNVELSPGTDTTI